MSRTVNELIEVAVNERSVAGKTETVVKAPTR